MIYVYFNRVGMIVKPFLKFSWRVERNILLRTGNFAYFACFCRGIVDNFLFPVDRSCDILNFSPREKQRRPKRRKKGAARPAAWCGGAGGSIEIDSKPCGDRAEELFGLSFFGVTPSLWKSGMRSPVISPATMVAFVCVFRALPQRRRARAFRRAPLSSSKRPSRRRWSRRSSSTSPPL